eukprot:gene9443-10430_t
MLFYVRKDCMTQEMFTNERLTLFIEDCKDISHIFLNERKMTGLIGRSDIISTLKGDLLNGQVLDACLQTLASHDKKEIPVRVVMKQQGKERGDTSGVREAFMICLRIWIAAESRVAMPQIRESSTFSRVGKRAAAEKENCNIWEQIGKLLQKDKLPSYDSDSSGETSSLFLSVIRKPIDVEMSLFDECAQQLGKIESFLDINDPAIQERRSDRLTALIGSASYPLAIATTDGKLYQPGSKAKFRNYIIEEADASIMSPPLQATWIYDAMATIRASKPAKTWGDYMANQLRSFTPASPLNAAESKCIFEKARKGNHLHLLDKLGTARTLDAEDQHDVTSFIKNVIYNGKSDEDLVSLRIRQYDRLRLKTTQTIIPDPGSIAYAVKRANMAAYYLKHFGTRIVQKINPCDSGWYCKDGVLNPRWYDGPQMPPSATARQNRPRSQHTTDVETSGSDAEREELNNDFDAHDDNASEVEFWEQLFEDFSSESDEYDSDDPEYLP